MSNQALFYPYIDIKDEQWLKTSLLYWDELCTIVPKSIDNPYNSNLSRFLADEGILKPILVQSGMEEIEELAESVLTYLSTNEGARVVAMKRNRGSVIHTEKLPNSFNRFVHIHQDKLPNMVRNELMHIYGSNREDSWLTVDGGFADFYMTLLATKLSERTGASLVTADSMANDLAIAINLDAPLGQEVSNIFGHEDRYNQARRYEVFGHRRNRPSAVAEGLLANLAISKITISSETSIQDLIEFKNQHSDELGRFHTAIRGLCSGIDGNIPIEALQERVSTIYRNEVQPSISDLKSALDGKNIKWIAQGLMGLSCISVGPYSALAVSGLSTPVALLATAGLSLAAMGVLYNTEKHEHERNNPFAYLLSAQQEFRR
ncbi:MAG: hypothetical protein QX196_08725 [Methylococcaceae bacterium]